MAALEKAITTQEELNEVIKDRLQRERESTTRKYEGWTSPDDLKKIKDTHAEEVKKLQDAAEKSKKTIAAKDEEIAKSAKYRTDLEKTRIALEAGLDIKYADRLRGENAEEWKADAKDLAKDFAGTHRRTPPASNEPVATNDRNAAENAAFKTMLSDLEG